MVSGIVWLFPLSSFLWAFPNTRLFMSGNFILCITAKIVSNCDKQVFKSHSCHQSSLLERHMECFPSTQQWNNLWETRDKKVKELYNNSCSYSLFPLHSRRGFIYWWLCSLKLKKNGTSSWDPFGAWISHSHELLQDAGLQKACCVHKHMEVVWHFCKYYFVQSYCLKKKALGISVQFFQLGECFAFKVRSMFKFSNFRHSS